MITQHYQLNLIPTGKDPAIVRCSQYDKDSRSIEFSLFNGKEPFALGDGYVVTVRGTKQDGNAFEYDCSIVDTNAVFSINQQMTLFAGKYPCELRIVVGDEILGSANFYLYVEKSPMDEDSAISESDLPVYEKLLLDAQSKNVSDWLEENISQETGYVIDTSLSVSGAAADAKVVGDEIQRIEAEIVASAELDAENIAHFKDANGITIFTLDLSDMGTPTTYGNLVLSTDTLTIEEESSANFTISLASAPGENQPVYIAVSDNTKIAVSPAALTFTASNWNVPQTVTVSALSDADSDDENETVTVTSRKVASKQIAISVTDITEPPAELITDGLDLYFNLRNGSSGLTDSIQGIMATQTNGEFVDGGLKLPSSNANMAWAYPVTTNIPNGFTIEYAISNKDKSSGAWVPYLAAAGSGYGGGYAFQYSWYNGSIRSGFAYNINGTLTKDQNILFSMDSFNVFDFDSEHTVSTVWNADSSVDVYIDGTRIGGRDVLADFDSYAVSGTMNFKFPYSTSNSFPSFTIAELRFYNRALTGAEVLNNYKSDVSRQSTANFS